VTDRFCRKYEKYVVNNKQKFNYGISIFPKKQKKNYGISISISNRYQICDG